MYQIEKRFDGYWGVFEQNLTEFRTNLESLSNLFAIAGNILKGVGERENPEKADVLSFMAIDVAPYNFAVDIVRDFKFRTGGPLFSMLVETAKYGNFRWGIHL